MAQATTFKTGMVCSLKFVSSHKKQLTQNIEQHTGERHINTLNQQSKQESSISQIIRTYGKQFTQIQEAVSRRTWWKMCYGCHHVLFYRLGW